MGGGASSWPVLRNTAEKRRHGLQLRGADGAAASAAAAVAGMGGAQASRATLHPLPPHTSKRAGLTVRAHMAHALALLRPAPPRPHGWPCDAVRCAATPLPCLPACRPSLAGGPCPWWRRGHALRSYATHGGWTGPGVGGRRFAGVGACLRMGGWRGSGCGGKGGSMHFIPCQRGIAARLLRSRRRNRRWVAAQLPVPPLSYRTPHQRGQHLPACACRRRCRYAATTLGMCPHWLTWLR